MAKKEIVMNILLNKIKDRINGENLENTFWYYYFWY